MTTIMTPPPPTTPLMMSIVVEESPEPIEAEEDDATGALGDPRKGAIEGATVLTDKGDTESTEVENTLPND